MKVPARVAAVAIPIAGLIAVAVFVNGSAVGIAYKPKAFQLGADLAASLFVIALFLERSMAVINNLVFPGEKSAAEKAWLAASDHNTWSTAHNALLELNAKEEKVRLAVGFIFALLISGAGPRTLSALLDFKPDQVSPQLRDLFYGVDIVLTAGLLAGGSNGLALIIETIKKQMQVSYWRALHALKR